MKRVFLFLAALTLCVLCACSKGEKAEEPHLDVSDPEKGVRTAAELIYAVERSSDISLASNIDLGENMLKVNRTNSHVRIRGNGFSITSSSDCVVRLEDGCSVELEDLELKAGACGIGCLGDAKVSGKELKISALTDGIRCAGELKKRSFDLNVAFKHSAFHR